MLAKYWAIRAVVFLGPKLSNISMRTHLSMTPTFPILIILFLNPFQTRELHFGRTFEHSAMNNKSKYSMNFAAADRDRITQRCGKAFKGTEEEALVEGIKYLLEHPPKKQAIIRGTLSWQDSQPDRNSPMLQNLLVLVRRVRNNLFHGGKFPGGPVKERVSQCEASRKQHNGSRALCRA